MAVIPTGNTKNGKDMNKKMTSLERWTNDPRWKDVNKLRQRIAKTRNDAKRILLNIELLALHKAIDKSHPA